MYPSLAYAMSNDCMCCCKFSILEYISIANVYWSLISLPRHLQAFSQKSSFASSVSVKLNSNTLTWNSRPPLLLNHPNVGLLVRRCSGKGLHLAMKGEPRGFSRVTEQNCGCSRWNIRDARYLSRAGLNCQKQRINSQLSGVGWGQTLHFLHTKRADKRELAFVKAKAFGERKWHLLLFVMMFFTINSKIFWLPFEQGSRCQASARPQPHWSCFQVPFSLLWAQLPRVPQALPCYSPKSCLGSAGWMGNEVPWIFNTPGYHSQHH